MTWWSYSRVSRQLVESVRVCVRGPWPCVGRGAGRARRKYTSTVMFMPRALWPRPSIPTCIFSPRAVPRPRRPPSRLPCPGCLPATPHKSTVPTRTPVQSAQVTDTTGHTRDATRDATPDAAPHAAPTRDGGRCRAPGRVTVRSRRISVRDRPIRDRHRGGGSEDAGYADAGTRRDRTSSHVRSSKVKTSVKS